MRLHAYAGGGAEVSSLCICFRSNPGKTFRHTFLLPVPKGEHRSSSCGALPKNRVDLFEDIKSTEQGSYARSNE